MVLQTYAEHNVFSGKEYCTLQEPSMLVFVSLRPSTPAYPHRYIQWHFAYFPAAVLPTKPATRPGLRDMFRA